MYLLLLFIISIIYISQNKDILQKFYDKLEQIKKQQEDNKIKDQIEQEKQQSLELLLQQLQEKEYVDCIGSFEDWSECNIEKCDISNNINGIGKKTRKYIIKKVPKSGGKICPTTETTDCIKEDYEFCKICKGRWGIESDCQNITECNKTTGKGTKNKNYITTEPLVNCILPRTLKVDCSIINYPSCTCSYDISSNINCNDNNTICEGGVSKCTLDYTKTSEVKGGICPAPNNIYEVIDDQRCYCTVERTFGDWDYTDERCDSKTYYANRSRIITVRKTGGLKGCIFLKKQNEDSENIFKNPNGHFQFSADDDNIDATFDIIQTENIIWPNNNKCICKDTIWIDYNTCPSRTDYSILDSNFYKIQKRATTETIYDLTCDNQNVPCPRDCSGNWNDWSICNNQGKRTRTFRTLFNKLNNGTNCPRRQTEDCPFDCVGEFDKWSECNVKHCDISNNSNGIGTKTREYIIREYPQNLGKPCPTTDTTSCVKEDYEFCKECNGRWGIESDCQKVTKCEGTIGIGEKSRNYLSSDMLANCIMPRTQKVNCSIINYPTCTCSYDISSNINCNDNNTICEGGKSKCILDYTKIPEITGGICPAPNNIYEKIGDSRCNCRVERTFDNWNYTVERCNSTTYSANRSRIIKVTKIEGLKGCTFIKEQNEDSENKFKNPNGKFQFSAVNDKIDASFNIIQTENINLLNNDKCICEGTRWVDYTTCPSRTNYSISDSDFYKVQKRTTTKTTPGITCDSQNVLCPRDCSGNWNNWSVCNKDGKKTRTFRTLFNKLNNGSDCPSEQTEDCPFDCVGGFDKWSECNVKYCDISNNINGIGTKTREYIISEFPKNFGKPCPTTDTTECIKENYEFCKICEGSWGIESDCQNVTVCDKTVGKGEKSQNYISTYPLTNCILPRTRKIDCEVINYPSCTCSYDISSNENCNDNNTVCEAGISRCILDYTKTPEITGGICPAPNNIYYNIDNQRCYCTVEKTFDNWYYKNQVCNNTTYFADRSRIITVKKKGGFKGCTFIKEENEDSEKIYKNPNGDFQFNSSDDKIDASFNITQTESIISFNDYRCSDDCYGFWEPWRPCNASCDGINTSATGNITRTYKIINQAKNRGNECSIPNNKIEIGQICFKTDCPVNCTWEPNEWSSCNAVCDGATRTRTGIRTRTFRIRTNAINGGICIQQPTDQIETCLKTDCPVNCTWEPNEWSSCNAVCDGVSATRTGTRKRTFRRTRDAINSGTCIQQPTEQSEICIKSDCSVNCTWEPNEWSNCIATCATRTGYRTRTFRIRTNAINGGTCIQQPIEQRELCTKVDCSVLNISGGGGHSLFLKYNSTVCGCGDNVDGQLGLGDDWLYSVERLQGYFSLGFITNIIQISAGKSHSLFLKTDKTAWSCGNNKIGQLGIDTYNNNNTLQQVMGINGIGFITNITQISAGDYHSLFLKNDRTVLSCGSNSNGQLGIGNNINQPVLQQVIGATNIIQISAGAEHSLFLKEDGTVWGCGQNYQGQLGINNNNNNNNILQQVKGVNGVGFITNIKQISAGAYHSLFLDEYEIVYSCGSNEFGQLGIGNNIYKNTLQQVLQVFSGIFIKQISAGKNHSLFLKDDETVLACGKNQFGQLGIGNNYTKYNLEQIIGASNITKISAGSDYSLFLKNDSTTWGCGYGYYIGKSDNQNTIQQISIP